MTNKTLIIASALLSMCLVTTSSANLAADIFTGNDFVQMGNTYNGTQYNYGIGKYELTQSQWNSFAAEAASNGQDLYAQTIFSGYGDGGTPYDWSTITGSTAVPATIMNWYQAAQFCNYMTSGNINDGAYVFGNSGYISTDRTAALGMHNTVFVLPTVNEWMNAAYYDGDNTYSKYATGATAPTGWNYDQNTYDTYIANGTIPLDIDSNIQAPNYSTPDNTDNIYTPWIVGSGTEEQNGTYDMMGNVWEWIEDGGTEPLIGGSAHEDLFISSDNPLYPTSPQIPGGIWSEATAGAWSGLRIAAVGDLSAIPEPASIAMIALVSGVALFVRRWFLI